MAELLTERIVGAIVFVEIQPSLYSGRKDNIENDKDNVQQQGKGRLCDPCRGCSNF